jgi:hypothetical protein
MHNHDGPDRADATVWLPLLHILGGVAQRVARDLVPDPPPGADAASDTPSTASRGADRRSTSGRVRGASREGGRP